MRIEVGCFGRYFRAVAVRFLAVAAGMNVVSNVVTPLIRQYYTVVHIKISKK